jgi:hypothetical protein
MPSRFQIRRNNTCARCQNTLGLRSHEPDEQYWGIDGKLCKNCYTSIKSGIQEYEVYYLGGYNRLPQELEGRMTVLLFDERKEIILTPKKKSFIPLRITASSLTDCEIISRNETTSLSRRVFTAGISRRKDKRYLQIGFREDGEEEMSLLLELESNKLDPVYNTISLIKAAREDEEEDHEDGEDDEQKLVLYQKTICNVCESPNEMEAQFCSKCGNKLSGMIEEANNEVTSLTPTSLPPAPSSSISESYSVEKQEEAIYLKSESPVIESYSVEKEKAYFRSEGEVIVRKTEHRGAGRKVASWLAAGPIGYVALGRDKTRKTKAKGTLVLTDKAIYCAGNVYPYDTVLAFTRKRKSILLLFEKSFNDQRFSVTLELKTKEINDLFRALETARMGHIKF